MEKTANISRRLKCFILALAGMTVLGAGPASADEGGTLVQVATANANVVTFSIDVVCDRGRALVVFRNLGLGWNAPATLSAVHADSRQALTRRMKMTERQVASFRLPRNQADGTIKGEITAPWLDRPYDVSKNVACGEAPSLTAIRP